MQEKYSGISIKADPFKLATYLTLEAKTYVTDTTNQRDQLLMWSQQQRLKVVEQLMIIETGQMLFPGIQSVSFSKRAKQNEIVNLLCKNRKRFARFVRQKVKERNWKSLAKLVFVRQRFLDSQEQHRLPLVQPRDGVKGFDLVGVGLRILLFDVFTQSLVTSQCSSERKFEK